MPISLESENWLCLGVVKLVVSVVEERVHLPQLDLPISLESELRLRPRHTLWRRTYLYCHVLLMDERAPQVSVFVLLY
jgi:hypothetical protein